MVAELKLNMSQTEQFFYVFNPWSLSWDWPSSGTTYDSALESTYDLSPGIDLPGSGTIMCLGMTSAKLVPWGNYRDRFSRRYSNSQERLFPDVSPRGNSWVTFFRRLFPEGVLLVPEYSKHPPRCNIPRNCSCPNHAGLPRNSIGGFQGYFKDISRIFSPFSRMF